MLPRGIARKLDVLGRATLPKEYRNTMGLRNRDTVNLVLCGQAIVIKKGQANFIGITRPLDDLGRITLPIEFRKYLGMGPSEVVDMYIVDGDIHLKRLSLQCVCCGSDNERELKVHQGVHLCGTCLAEFNNTTL